MSCKDFVPANLQKGPSAALTAPTYAKFGTCVESANQWLSENASARLINAETINITGNMGKFYKFNSGYSTSTEFYEEVDGLHTRYGACSLKGLRIWYASDNTGPFQQLAYKTVVPTLVDASMSMPIFDDMDVTIDKYNQQIQQNAPPGSVLNIETVKQPCGQSGGVDAERTCYEDKEYKLDVVRIWYLKGEATGEEIGYKNFLPVTIPGVYNKPKPEDLSVIFSRARNWIQSQEEMRFTNIECGYLKTEGGTPSKRTLNRYSYASELLQFVRVWFVRPTAEISVPRPPMINYFNIKPAEKSRFGSPEMQFETISQMVERYHQWLLECDAMIVGVQTFPVPCQDLGVLTPRNPDLTSHKISEHNRYLLRVYLEVKFRPPWPGIVQDPPKVRGCCVVL